jgi:tRNA pseudouridine38-40 synthase
MRSPLLRRTALWVRQPLCVAAMNEAAQLLVGFHDFGTFGSAPRSTPRKGDGRRTVRVEKPSTVRHVKRAAWAQPGEQMESRFPAWQQALLDDTPQASGDAQWQGVTEFTIEANAFLYHMVRSIVGTLLQVGRGERTVSEFGLALHRADRALAGPTVGPQGLCLIGVLYPSDS